jgi:hypothetical protein
MYQITTKFHNSEDHKIYVGVLISLWLFPFAAQPKEFFYAGLKKLEQRSHSAYRGLTGRCLLINEPVRMWKKASVVYFQVICRQFPEGNEENQ